MAPNQLPYTLAAEQFKEEYPSFSASKMNVSQGDQEIVHPNEETVSGNGYYYSNTFNQVDNIVTDGR